MKLVYVTTGKPVAIGDAVTISGQHFTVAGFRQPHKPSSEGFVTVQYQDSKRPNDHHDYYVSVIAAVWIDREDRR